MGKCWKEVVKKLRRSGGSVVEKCCEEVLWRSVVKECCEGVVKWCRDVL